MSPATFLRSYLSGNQKWLEFQTPLIVRALLLMSTRTNLNLIDLFFLFVCALLHTLCFQAYTEFQQRFGMGIRVAEVKAVGNVFSLLTPGNSSEPRPEGIL